MKVVKICHDECVFYIPTDSKGDTLSITITCPLCRKEITGDFPIIEIDWRIIAKTVSITAFTTLGGLYSVFMGTTTGQHILTLLGILILAFIAYYLLRW